MKLVIEISDEDIIDWFKQVNEAYGTFKKNPDMKKLKKELEMDLGTYLTNDLSGFLEDGMNADIYWEFMDPNEY